MKDHCTNISKITNKIINVFHHEVENLALETKFKQKNSKLSPSSFLITFILGFLINSKASYEDMCQYILKYEQLKISKQGIWSRVNSKFCIPFMKKCLNFFITEFQNEQPKIIVKLNQFAAVKIIDSTHISLPNNLKNHFAGFGGGASDSGMKLQTVLSLLNNSIVHLNETASNKNDQGYKNHLGEVKKNELYLQDLGYYSLSNFQVIHKKEAYFISKMHTNISFYDEKRNKIKFYNYCKDTSLNIFSFKAYLGKYDSIPIKVIAKRAPQEVVDKRMKRAIRESKGKQISKDKLALMHWTVYITNVPEDKLSDEDIYKIYPLRWQVELLFKVKKSLISIDHVSGRKKSKVLCEIYAKSMLLILFLHIISPIKRNGDQDISLYKSYNKLKNCGMDLLRSFSSKYKLKNFISTILDDILLFGMKDKSSNRKTSTMNNIKKKDTRDWPKVDLAKSGYLYEA